MKLLDIGEVSARSGIKPSALRYYEEVGLIGAVARHGLRRQFGPEVLMQLKLIAMGKSAGFSLEEIVGMFGQNGMPDLSRSMFQQKAQDIDRKMEELASMRDMLNHIANCPAQSHLECPSFRRLLSAVNFGEKTKDRPVRKPKAG